MALDNRRMTEGQFLSRYCCTWRGSIRLWREWFQDVGAARELRRKFKDRHRTRVRVQSSRPIDAFEQELRRNVALQAARYQSACGQMSLQNSAYLNGLQNAAYANEQWLRQAHNSPLSDLLGGRIL